MFQKTMNVRAKHLICGLALSFVALPVSANEGVEGVDSSAIVSSRALAGGSDAATFVAAMRTTFVAGYLQNITNATERAAVNSAFRSSNVGTALTAIEDFESGIAAANADAAARVAYQGALELRNAPDSEIAIARLASTEAAARVTALTNAHGDAWSYLTRIASIAIDLNTSATEIQDPAAVNVDRGFGSAAELRDVLTYLSHVERAYGGNTSANSDEVSARAQQRAALLLAAANTAELIVSGGLDSTFAVDVFEAVFGLTNSSGALLETDLGQTLLAGYDDFYDRLDTVAANLVTQSTRLDTYEAQATTNANAIQANTAAIQQHTTQINAYTQDITEVQQGVAMALAMGQRPVVEGSASSFTIGSGYYDGESAFALSWNQKFAGFTLSVSTGKADDVDSTSLGLGFSF